jgi:hypothetical protein
LAGVNESSAVVGLLDDHDLVRTVVAMLQPDVSESPQPHTGVGPQQDSECLAFLVSELVCSPNVDAVALCADGLHTKLTKAILAVLRSGTAASREMLGALFRAADAVVRQVTSVDTSASADSLEGVTDLEAQDATRICGAFLETQAGALRAASAHPDDGCAESALEFFESLVAVFPNEYEGFADYETLGLLGGVLDSEEAPTLLIETALRILLRAVSSSSAVVAAARQHPSLCGTVDAYAGGAGGTTARELASLAADVLEYLR